LKNYVYFLAFILFQNNPKPWFMCLKDTSQSSVVDSFQIIQIKQVYLFKTQNRNLEKKKKKKTEPKKREKKRSAHLDRPGAQTNSIT
jgi:hypothetical protein